MYTTTVDVSKHSDVSGSGLEGSCFAGDLRDVSGRDHTGCDENLTVNVGKTYGVMVPIPRRAFTSQSEVAEGNLVLSTGRSPPAGKMIYATTDLAQVMSVGQPSGQFAFCRDEGYANFVLRK